MTETDLTQSPMAQQENELREVLEQQRNYQIDPTRVPIFRYHLIRLSDLEHVLFTAVSPINVDGSSFDILWNDLRLGYAALSTGQPWPLPDLPIDYGDYVAWQQQLLAETEDELAQFWRRNLGDELPPLPLPTDHPRPHTPSPRRTNIPFRLPAEDAAQHLKGLIEFGIDIINNGSEVESVKTIDTLGEQYEDGRTHE